MNTNRKSYHFDSFLHCYDQSGYRSCRCGLSHHISTKAIYLGDNVLKRAGKLIRSRNGGTPKVWILSDENTEEAAGNKLKNCLNGVDFIATILPRNPKPVPTVELAHKLTVSVSQSAPDLLISVGSGTISDLVKKVSENLGIPNWSLASAPSVDAYTSGTASLKKKNYHIAARSQPSEVVLCDLEVLSHAPEFLFLSGAGDLAAKFIAYLDWRVASWVTGETFCEHLANFALDSARTAVQTLRGNVRNKTQTVETLTDALLSSGLTIQSYGSSRAAASAEHTAAHHWEMAEAVGNEQLNLHGILVFIASRIVYRVYTDFFQTIASYEIDLPATLRRVKEEASWEQRLEPGMIPFKEKMIIESKGKHFDERIAAKHIEGFRKHRLEITSLAEQILPELDDALCTLAEAGVPTSLEVLRLDRNTMEQSFRYIKYLRNRYSSFNLMCLLGVEEQYQSKIRTIVDEMYRSD